MKIRGMYISKIEVLHILKQLKIIKMSGLTGGAGSSGNNSQGTVNGPGQGTQNIIGNAGNQNSLVKNSPIMQFNKQPSIPPAYIGGNTQGAN